ncbi:hypothetical protein SHAb15599_00163 [Acinetobacter phage SH-Ab 15599]|nr:hypothetical protein SHAb15599_00163 [Acinetobacter phage SH-Ab 15599]
MDNKEIDPSVQFWKDRCASGESNVKVEYGYTRYHDVNHPEHNFFKQFAVDLGDSTSGDISYLGRLHIEGVGHNMAECKADFKRLLDILKVKIAHAESLMDVMIPEFIVDKLNEEDLKIDLSQWGIRTTIEDERKVYANSLSGKRYVLIGTTNIDSFRLKDMKVEPIDPTK